MKSAFEQIPESWKKARRDKTKEAKQKLAEQKTGKEKDKVKNRGGGSSFMKDLRNAIKKKAKALKREMKPEEVLKLPEAKLAELVLKCRMKGNENATAPVESTVPPNAV